MKHPVCLPAVKIIAAAYKAIENGEEVEIDEATLGRMAKMLEGYPAAEQLKMLQALARSLGLTKDGDPTGERPSNNQTGRRASNRAAALTRLHLVARHGELDGESKRVLARVFDLPPEGELASDQNGVSLHSDGRVTLSAVAASRHRSGNHSSSAGGGNDIRVQPGRR